MTVIGDRQEYFANPAADQPGNGAQAAEHVSLQDAAAAANVWVAGQALVVRIQVSDAHDADTCVVLSQLGLAHAVEARLRRHLRATLGRRYGLEHVSTRGDVATVTVFGQEARRRTWGQTLRFGQQWAERAARFVVRAREDVRRGAERAGITGANATVAVQLGADVHFSTDAIDSTQTAPALRQHIRELTDRERRLGNFATFSVLFAIALGTVTALALKQAAWDTAFVPGTYTVIALAGAAYLWQARTGAREDAREARQILDLRDVLEGDEQRAYKLFQLNSFEIKRGYDQALRQRGWVFLLGLVCIFAGFGCVAAAFAVIHSGAAPDLADKIVVASLGAVTGILANFIALIFLRMFSSTVSSMADLHDRLVVTHHAHFGNLLAARITDEQLKDQTLARMALAMGAGTSPPAVETPPPTAGTAPP
jgi:hypothetical protein